MKICIVGKYPPIQGGVSMRTYWTAHGLAALGHDVHVVTNAKEAVPPFRMHMRAEDWQRCEASGGTGSVTVHWTDPVDRSQSYLPMASPFVSKLATVAATMHSACPFDLVYSHYMEPYGVAGHLAAQMAGVPHVVRMAGSDSGRLWHHPQLEALYDHVLRSANVVVAADSVADRAMSRGVDARRIAWGGGYVVPEDLFAPRGPSLDVFKLQAEIREGGTDLWDALWGSLPAGLPYFGVYGKLGDQKGSFALLSAMQRLKCAGVEVGLVALAHGRPEVERRFRAFAEELGLADRVLQIPFLPHWRVPEFLRGSLAVCCLEQEFPIRFHAPVTPREVLLCGTCLVGSTEVIRKLPRWEQLPHGYRCVAVENVNDVEMLSERLGAIARDPALAAEVGRRGRRFARDLQRRIDFPHLLERVLVAAARGRRLSASLRAKAPASTDAEPDRFRLTHLVIEAMQDTAGTATRRQGRRPSVGRFEIGQAQQALADIEKTVERKGLPMRSFARAVQVEIAVARAEDEIDACSRAAGYDPLFRVDAGRWAIADEALPDLVPVRDPRLRILKFDYDVSAYRRARTVRGFPSPTSLKPSFIAVFGRCDKASRGPVVVDGSTVRILELSDGTRTVAAILLQLEDDTHVAPMANRLQWIEELFVRGFLQFHATKAKWV